MLSLTVIGTSYLAVLPLANRRMTKEEKETRRSLDAGPLGPKSSKLNAPLPTINKAQHDLSAQSSK